MVTGTFFTYESFVSSNLLKQIIKSALDRVIVMICTVNFVPDMMRSVGLEQFMILLRVCPYHRIACAAA